MMAQDSIAKPFPQIVLVLRQPEENSKPQDSPLPFNQVENHDLELPSQALEYRQVYTKTMHPQFAYFGRPRSRASPERPAKGPFCRNGPKELLIRSNQGLCEFIQSHGSSVRLHILVFFALSLSCLHAQEPAGENAQPSAQPVSQPVQDKRAYGVLPNYRTADGSQPFQPLTARQKLTIAAKDSFDGAVYPTAAIFSVVYQAENDNPSFGQGMKGYAQRVGAAFGDQMIGNMMTEGVMPALLHEDPRYFRRGQGSKKSRIWYAATRIFITPTDTDRQTFNFAEWGGNGVAVALSNVYYKDGRSVGDNIPKLLIQCGTDALSNVLKEFWPDVKHWMAKKRN